MTTKKSMCLSVLVGLVLLLVGLRIYLPYGVQWYINRTLSQPGGYYGQVGDVDIMLWRGAYSLENVIIIPDGGDPQRPLFEAAHVDFSLLWSALFDGALVGDIILTDPSINFIDAAGESRDQTGESENWLYLAEQLFPLKIDRLIIHNGAIRFYNPDVSPPIDIALHDIEATATNLVNSRDLSRDLVANFNAKGETAEQGTLTVNATLDPSTQKPTFDLDVQASEVALVNFKTLLDTYAPFDLEAGTLELAMELASDDGYVQGYVKPILKQVEIFSWKEDVTGEHGGLFEGLVEAGSAFVAELVENQSEDQIATRIPIEGELSDPQMPVLPAIGGILENAFIQAMRGDVEKSITLEDASAQKAEQQQDDANQ